MTASKSLGQFTSEEDLRRSVASVKATLALSGKTLTPAEEAMLVQAVREGWSMDEYVRRVYEGIFLGSK